MAASASASATLAVLTVAREGTRRELGLAGMAGATTIIAVRVVDSIALKVVDFIHAASDVGSAELIAAAVVLPAVIVLRQAAAAVRPPLDDSAAAASVAESDTGQEESLAPPTAIGDVEKGELAAGSAAVATVCSSGSSAVLPAEKRPEWSEELGGDGEERELAVGVGEEADVEPDCDTASTLTWPLYS